MSIRYPAVIDGDRGGYSVAIPDIPVASVAICTTVDEALPESEEILPSSWRCWKHPAGPYFPPNSIEDVKLRPGEKVAFVTLRVPETP
jgi:hypothetical protein